MSDGSAKSEKLCLIGLSYSVGRSLGSVTVGDLDADGFLDLAVTNWGIVFIATRCQSCWVMEMALSRVDVREFNGDDRPDLAVSAGEDTSIVSVLFNTTSCLMPVASIDPFYRPEGDLYRVGTNVTIQDTEGSPVASSRVRLTVRQ